MVITESAFRRCHMSQLPSHSRIALWKGTARQIDSHFGYGYFADGKGSGPCHYVTDELEPRMMFTNLVCTTFVDDYLEAMNLVREGTPSCLFTKESLNDRGYGFNLWWPEIDEGTDELIKMRGYLTDDLRSTLVDTVFKTRLFRLDSKALEAKYHKLVEARDRFAESEPQWGAMYLIIRLFEATIAHVAWRHQKTRSMIEGRLGEPGSEKRQRLEELAYEQALASNKRWRLAIGLDEPETEAKILPFLRLIRGEKT